jgi:hypothetical protein
MTTIVDGTTGITFPSTISGVSATQQYSGRVLQVVQGTLSGSISTASSTLVDTGLTASITPINSANKILVCFTHPVPIKTNTNSDLTLALVRNSTTLITYNDALYSNGITNNYGSVIGGSYLDSPTTTSAVTYKTQFQNGQGSSLQVYCQGSGPGTIILMEIAA